MEFKSDALFLRAVDHGECDRIATLFTAEKGKILATVRGVRKEKAKLKFAVQPFCFAEYVFAVRGGRHTVTGATLHEGFYSLRENVERLYAASAVVGACDVLLFEGMQNPALLLCAVEALRELSMTDETDMPLLRFLLAALREAGYPVTATERCLLCGAPLRGRIRFDMETGVFTCSSCTEEVPASESCLQAVLGALSGEEKGEPIRALRLLRAYLLRKTETELPALMDYLTLRTQ